MTEQADLSLKTHQNFKSGLLGCTEQSANESPLCVFTIPGMLSLSPTHVDVYVRKNVSVCQLEAAQHKRRDLETFRASREQRFT